MRHRTSLVRAQVCPRRQHSARNVTRCAAGSRVDTLRELLAAPGPILQGPCCHDALSAKLIEQAGFPLAFMSGFSTSAARLGAPDTGLISYYEMVEQGRNITEATKELPIIGDGDTGYGNAMNVRRTVAGYAAAGFAGILIEDQIAPKSCGHVRGKRVVSRQEAAMRIRAAADERDSGSDIVIVARTDARQAVSLEEALWRVEAFVDAGADMVFIDALESQEEMALFCKSCGKVPKMASMLEGGGKTPLLRPAELQALGFRVVAYPLSLLGVSVRAMQGALQDLKAGAIPAAMPSFQELQTTIGFDDYFKLEERYAVKEESPEPPQTPAAAPAGVPNIPPTVPSIPLPVLIVPPAVPDIPPTAPAIPPPAPDAAAPPAASEAAGTMAEALGLADSGPEPAAAEEPETSKSQGSSSGLGPEPSTPAAAGGESFSVEVVVEPDAVLLAPRGGALTVRPADGDAKERDAESAFSRAKFLRVCITDMTSNQVKLETRIPAGFLTSISAFIPQVSGIDLSPEALIRAARGEDSWDITQPLVDFENNGDRIQVFIEL